VVTLFLHPLVLCGLLWLIARHNAEFSFARVFFVALGIGLAGIVAGAALGPGLGLLALLVMAGVCVYFLMKFCYTTLGQALATTGLYFVYQVAFVLLTRGV